MAHRNFDAEAAHAPREADTFTIAGETFTLRGKVKPEVLVEYEEGVNRLDELSPTETMELLDRTIRQLIVPRDRERWDALRAGDDDSDDGPAIGPRDQGAILRHLVRHAYGLAEAETGLPISPSSGSSTPPDGTDSSSQAASFSPADADFVVSG